ncbi:glycosyltransferase family 39 protein [Paenibacillus sp. NPDC058071]|uniref:glycosyltransferase family 39 protein n=1 Tax=Paenibacillus sp. NPDC058071 TaxID=3346326 RepID=UPI0036DD2D4F
MRKFGLIQLLIALTVLWIALPTYSVLAADNQQNLLQNAGFEQVDSGSPASWTQDVWVHDSGVTRFGVDSSDTHSGGQAALIENVQPNHSKWVQNIAVKPNAYYRVSGWIKVTGTDPNAIGANLFVMGVGEEFPHYLDTGGQWQPVEFYGKTGAGQKEIGIGLALGGYSSLNKGRALFDDISVEQVKSLPKGATAIPFAPAGGNEAAGGENKPEIPAVSAFPELAISAAFGAFFLFLYKGLLRQRHPLERSDSNRSNSLGGWLIIAFGFRILVAGVYPGYISDLNTFIYWGNDAFHNGISQFYREGAFADYPPGYIYVLYLLGMLQSMFGMDSMSSGTIFLFKLPAMVADLAACVLIYQTAWKRIGGRPAFGLALLYMFNPAVWVDSAAWGQVDSIFTLFLLLAIISVVDNRLERGAVWFAIAVLVKPQALIFTPVILLAIWHKKEWKRSAISAGYGLAVFFALALPFFWSNGGLGGLINLYKTTLASYPYATLNAFNLYSLTGGNWKPLDATWLSVPYKVFGNLAIVLAVALAAWFSLKGKDKKDLSKSFFIGVVLIMIVFLFATKMHERYMYPALLLSVFAYVYTKDRRLLHVLFGFSVTLFVNISYVLAFSPYTTGVPADGIVLLFSICNLGLLIYMLYVGYDVYIRGRVLPLEPITPEGLKQRDEQLLEEVKSSGDRHDEKTNYDRARTRLGKKDWIWMAAITVVYAAFALFNLGTIKSLDTGWKPQAAGHSFYVDFGENVQLAQMNSFGGYGSGKYKLEFAYVPTAWSAPIDLEQKGGDDLKWAMHPLNVETRYVKLTAVEMGFSMQEIAFFAKGSETPLAIREVIDEGTGSGPSPSRLFDEQSSVSFKENYINSSYFDEIYHARTALEHIEGVRAYENTHPPLGKLIIALGIKLFGLSPFGWRLMGTLFGIAMVPILYLFALRLFRKTAYAAAASILLAAEFMHFTQTRIATIDVYGVFFIILMFYFMHKYVSMDFYRTPLRKLLVPLFWAGLLFGIGVASKWIVIYGGAGLAVMLFWSLAERYRQYAAAKRALKGDLKDKETFAAYREAIQSFPRKTIAILVSCIGFYVIVPLLIYSLSYIPVLSVPGDQFTATRLVEYQKNMYNYHSNLVSTHPYSSQWWEWPFMKRPVWYYSGEDVSSPDHVSTISAFGNPIIWWFGLFALLLSVYLSLKRKDKYMYVVWIAYFSQYLPWMLVPRLTFIYHYFAMVPFMILSIVYLFKLYEEKYPQRRWLRYGFTGAAVLLFLIYYPVLSGFEVSKAYAEGLRLFQSWVFYR